MNACVNVVMAHIIANVLQCLPNELQRKVETNKDIMYMNSYCIAAKEDIKVFSQLTRKSAAIMTQKKEEKK